MNLSAAIRCGAKLKPQGHGSLLRDGATCAIGAALDSIGMLEEALRTPEPYQIAQALWPVLNAELETFIILKNDGDKWTREQIADEVEIYEALEAAATAVPALVNA